MGTLVRVQHKGQMTIPSSVRSAVGLADGDLVEVRAVGKKILIVPHVAIDRAKPNSNGEYTPAQRRAIDARLAEADADIKAGRVSEAFSDHGEFIADLHKAAAKLSASKTKRPAK